MNSWEQSSFTAIEINNYLQSGVFIVPQYQRGYVWKEPTRSEFVDTLKRGLPFGSILLYRDEQKNNYQIIDGLQRCTTIYGFINNPSSYFDEGDISEDLPHQLAQITGITNYSCIIENIRSTIVNWVRGSFQSMDDVRDMQYNDFAIAFSNTFPSARGKEQEIVAAVKPTLRNFKDLCNNLCTVRIPAIVIKGDDDALPEIFERINSKGTQLSKYQIYSATWRKSYSITSSKLEDLLRYNKERFESMSLDGAEIADFNSVAFMRNKKLTLFEIAYALGKKLGNDYPHLFSTKKEIKDVDSLGFSLITSCVGLKNANSKKLHIAFEDIVGESQVNKFLERILLCVDTASKLIGKFNKFKVNSRNEVGPLHTEFQIVALVSNIFVNRYASYENDESDKIVNFSLSLNNSNPGWDDYENSLKKNCWKRYCLDVLNARWKGSGDKKLDSAVFDSSYYSQNISWKDFESSLSQWFDSVKLEKREHKRVTPPLEPEKMFLALLYLPIFSAQDQIDQSRYDVEHLATKNLLKKCLDRYDGALHLPIGSIGNLCLLPQKENRSKKDKTIYDDNSFLQRSNYTLAELEEKFTFTESSDLEWTKNHTISKEEFKELYDRYIDRRFKRMLDKIKNSYEF